MTTKTLIAIAACALLLVAAATFVTGQDPDADQATATDGFGVQLSVDKVTYAVGDPIILTVSVFNGTDESLVLPFNNSQRYDYSIDDSEGNQVWLWSGDRMFLQALGVENLGPDKPCLRYEQSFTGELAPGVYTVTGSITSRTVPVSASTTIVVK